MSVHVTSKCHRWGSAEGIEIFAISPFIVDIDDYPVLTRSVRWIGVADQQTREVDLRQRRRRNVALDVERRVLCPRYSCSKVVDNVSVSVDLDHVLELRIDHHGDRHSSRFTEFQYQSHTSLTHQIETFFIAQIGREIKGVQRIAISVVVSIDACAFVSADLSGPGEQRVVSWNVLTVWIVQLHRFYTLLLLSVQIQRYFGDIEMLKLERISFPMSVECFIGHYSPTTTRVGS